MPSRRHSGAGPHVAIPAQALTSPFRRRPSRRHSGECPHVAIPAQALTSPFRRRPSRCHSSAGPHVVIPAQALTSSFRRMPESSKTRSRRSLPRHVVSRGRHVIKLDAGSGSGQAGGESIEQPSQQEIVSGEQVRGDNCGLDGAAGDFDFSPGGISAMIVDFTQCEYRHA